MLCVDPASEFDWCHMWIFIREGQAVKPSAGPAVINAQIYVCNGAWGNVGNCKLFETAYCLRYMAGFVATWEQDWRGIYVLFELLTVGQVFAVEHVNGTVFKCVQNVMLKVMEVRTNGLPVKELMDTIMYWC